MVKFTLASRSTTVRHVRQQRHPSVRNHDRFPIVSRTSCSMGLVEGILRHPGGEEPPQRKEEAMRHIAALAAALSVVAALGGPASAKSVWDQLAESAPRTDKPFVDIDMTAPRSVFTDLADTAPRAGAQPDGAERAR
jgi:hypothetical protein